MRAGNYQLVLVMWRQVALAFTLLAFVLLPAGTAAADTSGSGTVTVSAQVAAVRLVLLDSHDNILEVQSNSAQPVAPTYYRTTFDNAPIMPDLTAQNRYLNLISSLDTSHFGTIYNKPIAKPPVSIWHGAQVSSFFDTLKR